MSGLVTEPGRVLRIAEVRARYGLHDRRAARAVMEQAGAFLIAGRLVVPADRLAAWERRRDAERRVPVDLACAARSAGSS